MRVAICAILFFCAGAAMAGDEGQEVVTLYRSSVLDSTMRLHVATFDAVDQGPTYNSENCQLAAQLFQDQPGVTVRFWCEPGRYRAIWK